MTGKRLDLGRSVREGRTQGERLRRREALAGGNSSTVHEDCRLRIEEARTHADRDGLVDREWVLMTIRGVEGSLASFEDPRAEELRAMARGLRAEIVQRDEVDFAPMRVAIREGRYSVDDWLADVRKRTPVEGAAFTHRLLDLAEPPRPKSKRAADMVHFVASSLDAVRDIASYVGPDDVFYDVGCGTGMVALLVRWLTGATTKGIEFDAAYVEKACAARDALGFDATFIVGDARDFDYADATVLYLFEPFRGQVMAQFLERLDARRAHGPFRLVVRPAVEDETAKVSWLRFEEERPSGVRLYRTLPVA